MSLASFRFVLFSLSILSAQAFAYNMAYVEINNNEFSNVGCYIREDNQKPFFDMASIMAANINGDDPNKPYVFFNPEVSHLLNETDSVQKLQKQKILVFLTILGNHQNAGWACFTDENAIQKFADDVVNIANKYNLDGIDIDDEYSKCVSNPTSMIRIAQAIKEHPKFKGKLLTKALFADRSYFASNYEGHKLADYLDLGFEMTYYSGSYEQRLRDYVKYGVSKENLALGISTEFSISSAISSAKFVKENGYGGIMVYNVRNDSFKVLNEIAKVEWNAGIKVTPDCLK